MSFEKNRDDAIKFFQEEIERLEQMPYGRAGMLDSISEDIGRKYYAIHLLEGAVSSNEIDDIMIEFGYRYG